MSKLAKPFPIKAVLLAVGVGLMVGLAITSRQVGVKSDKASYTKTHRGYSYEVNVSPAKPVSWQDIRLDLKVADGATGRPVARTPFIITASHVTWGLWPTGPSIAKETTVLTDNEGRLSFSSSFSWIANGAGFSVLPAKYKNDGVYAVPLSEKGLYPDDESLGIQLDTYIYPRLLAPFAN